MTCYCSSNSFYAVVVVRSKSTAANQAVYDNAGPYTNDAFYYIAAAWARENISRVPESYTVGDGSRTLANMMVYTNAKLKSNSRYGIFIRIDIQPVAGNVVGLCEISLHLYSHVIYYIRVQFLSQPNRTYILTMCYSKQVRWCSAAIYNNVPQFYFSCSIRASLVCCCATAGNCIFVL